MTGSPVGKGGEKEGFLTMVDLDVGLANYALMRQCIALDVGDSS